MKFSSSMAEVIIGGLIGTLGALLTAHGTGKLNGEATNEALESALTAKFLGDEGDADDK